MCDPMLDKIDWEVHKKKHFSAGPNTENVVKKHNFAQIMTVYDPNLLKTRNWTHKNDNKPFSKLILIDTLDILL